MGVEAATVWCKRRYRLCACHGYKPFGHAEIWVPRLIAKLDGQAIPKPHVAKATEVEGVGATALSKLSLSLSLSVCVCVCVCVRSSDSFPPSQAGVLRSGQVQVLVTHLLMICIHCTLVRYTPAERRLAL